jgi:hypothetical protein
LILKAFLHYVKDNSNRLFLTPFYSPPIRFAGTSAGTFHHVGRLATIENEVEVKPPPTRRVRFVDVEKLNSALISAPIPPPPKGAKMRLGEAPGAPSAVMMSVRGGRVIFVSVLV